MKRPLAKPKRGRFKSHLWYKKRGQFALPEYTDTQASNFLSGLPHTEMVVIWVSLPQRKIVPNNPARKIDQYQTFRLTISSRS